MKKLIALALSLCFILSLAACKDKNTTTDIKGIDVRYYAELGKMPESDYRLGEDVEKAYSEMLEKQEAEQNAASEDELEHSHEGFFVLEIEEDEFTALRTDKLSYYYLTDKKELGFTHIVSFGDAYGFKFGDVSIEIKEAMEANGLESTERSIGPDEFFFMPGALDCTCLEYSFGKNSVVFIFQDNSLCATALFTTDI